MRDLYENGNSKYCYPDSNVLINKLDIKNTKDLQYYEAKITAAKSLGLGTCWLGIYPDKNRQEDFRKTFNMPENIAPFCAIALGYPNEEIAMPNRFDKSKIHFEKW